MYVRLHTRDNATKSFNVDEEAGEERVREFSLTTEAWSQRHCVAGFEGGWRGCEPHLKSRKSVSKC